MPCINSISELEFENPNDSFAATSCASTCSNSTQTEFRRLSAKDFIADAEGLHHYTGMETYDKFMLLFYCLGNSVHSLKYFKCQVTSIPPEDQLLITLMKLRSTLDDFEICRKMNITQATLSNVFITWINFLPLQLGDIGFWSDRDLVHFYSPHDFFSKYPSTRLIVDGTECPMVKPSDSLAQQATFSTYKNKNTIKVLVGASPGGLVSFCSDAYGGSSSDRQIVERSQLMMMCDQGDSIMADKGFNVQDLFDPKDIKINIPSFFSKKNRMKNSTVKADRLIASKRVHIERVIGLGKTFKILTRPLNSSQAQLGSQIVKTCYYLCNFKRGIVPPDA